MYGNIKPNKVGHYFITSTTMSCKYKLFTYNTTGYTMEKYKSIITMKTDGNVSASHTVCSNTLS